MVSKTTTSEKNLNNEHRGKLYSQDNNKNTVQQAVNYQTVQYLSKC